MDIFGEKEAFSRYSNGYSNRFNRALYEVFTYYLSIPEVREQLEGKKGTFKEMFEMISQKDRAFNDSISSTTKDIRKLIYRFTKIHAVLKEIIDCEIPRLNVTDGTVSVEWG